MNNGIVSKDASGEVEVKIFVHMVAVEAKLSGSSETTSRVGSPHMSSK